MSTKDDTRRTASPGALRAQGAALALIAAGLGAAAAFQYAEQRAAGPGLTQVAEMVRAAGEEARRTLADGAAIREVLQRDPSIIVDAIKPVDPAPAARAAAEAALGDPEGPLAQRLADPEGPLAKALGGGALRRALEKDPGAVRAALMRDPAMAVDALQAYSAGALLDGAVRGVVSEADAPRILDPKTGTVFGGREGGHTVVVFTDPNCPYCKEEARHVLRLVKERPDVRLILRDLPIIGPESHAVTAIAIALARQGLYLPFYEAAAQRKGTIKEADALGIAAALGADMSLLQIDRFDGRTADQIITGLDLAGLINIKGTPTIVVDRTIIEGVVPFESMTAILDGAAVRPTDRPAGLTPPPAGAPPEPRFTPAPPESETK